MCREQGTGNRGQGTGDREQGAAVRRSRLALAWVAALGLALLAGCGQDARGIALAEVPGGDAAQGREAVAHYGCGSCHVIPGVPGARGVVGAPLTEFARRTHIAGNLPNTPENLIAWLRDPQAIEPGTAMPNLNVSESDARNLAAYLATLR
jgi:cytochrome c